MLDGEYLYSLKILIIPDGFSIIKKNMKTADMTTAARTKIKVLFERAFTRDRGISGRFGSFMFVVQKNQSAYVGEDCVT